MAIMVSLIGEIGDKRSSVNATNKKNNSHFYVEKCVGRINPEFKISNVKV